jgi:hypothetical protein
MPEYIRVDLDLLEEAFSLLIARLRASGGSTFMLDRDYYWSIPHDVVFDVDSAPENLTIGQIAECLDWLKALQADRERALPYHLVWLGDVLHAIGFRAKPDFCGPQKDSD